MTEIPVLDYQSNTAPQDFTASLKEIGFAVFKNHPLDNDLIDRVYDAWRAFYASEEKFDFPYSVRTHDGYVSPEFSEIAKGETIKDIKEFYHYLPAGRCPSHLRENTQVMFEQMNALAVKLLDWVEQNTPDAVKKNFSMPLKEMIKNSHFTKLRILNYPALQGDEELGAIRAAAHEDIDLLTLLPAATHSGLQVKNKAGDWLDVPCDKGWLIVNTGDMMQECSGGYYPSTTHRVINPEGVDAREARMSSPLFLHPNDEVVLSDRYTAKSYRAERFAEIGLDQHDSSY